MEKTRNRVTLKLPFLPAGQREVTFSIVAGAAAHLPAHLGREYLDQSGAVVDFKRGMLTVVDDMSIPHTVSLENTKQ
eukprot:2191211-Amphidinium_carterae.1